MAILSREIAGLRELRLIEREGRRLTITRTRGEESRVEKIVCEDAEAAVQREQDFVAAMIGEGFVLEELVEDETTGPVESLAELLPPRCELERSEDGRALAIRRLSYGRLGCDLGGLLAHRDCAPLEELELDFSLAKEGIDEAAEALIAAAPPDLKRLRLSSGGNRPELRPAVLGAEVSGLSLALSGLEELELAYLRYEKPGPMFLRSLQRLLWITVRAEDADVKALAGSVLPALERLELSTGEGFWSDVEPAWKAGSWRRLLKGETSPELEILCCFNSRLEDFVLELARSRLAESLRRLELFDCGLGDPSAEALAANAPRFKRLESLVLQDNRIGEEAADKLRAAFGARVSGLEPGYQGR